MDEEMYLSIEMDRLDARIVQAEKIKYRRVVTKDSLVVISEVILMLKAERSALDKIFESLTGACRG